MIAMNKNARRQYSAAAESGFLLLLLSGSLWQILALLSYVQTNNPYRLDVGAGLEAFFPNLFTQAAALLIPYSLALLFRGRGRVIWALGCHAVILALTVADLGYFRSYSSMLSLVNLKLFGMFEHVGGMALSLFAYSDLWLFLPLPLAVIYLLIWGRRLGGALGLRRLIPALFGGALGACLLLVAFSPAADSVELVRRVGSLGFHASDLWRSASERYPEKMTDAQQKEVRDYLAWNRGNAADTPYTGLLSGKNLIIIQVESLESFVIGARVDGQEITPNLNARLKNALYFPNVCEQVRGGNSSDCDLMLMSSLLPADRGSAFVRFPGSDVVSLQNILKDNGYQNAYAQAVNPAHWDYQTAHREMMEIETAYYRDAFELDETINGVLSDKSFLRQAIPIARALDAGGGPYYLHLVTETSHMPFDVPPSGLSLSPALEDSYVGRYLNAAHYTDACIGGFLDALESEGLLENAAVVITGDHGGLHKYYPNAISSLPEGERPDFLRTDTETTVPLIVCAPGLEQKTFENIGGQVDVMPTLLSLLGVHVADDENYMLGRDLTDVTRSYAVTKDQRLIGTLSGSDVKMALKCYEVSGYIIKSDMLAGK